MKMNLLVNENIDDHYEEWNRSIYSMENNLYYDMSTSSNEFLDELPNIEFNMLQEQMNLPLNFDAEFCEGPADPLDDINPDNLFYQKSFTELTPVKYEVHVTDTLLPSQLPMLSSLNLISDVSHGAEISEDFPDSKFGEEEGFSNYSQNNFYEQSILKEFVSIDSHEDIEAVTSNDFSILESCPDFDINIQEDFETILHTQNSWPSEYIKYETSALESENDNFETESNVSSAGSCTSTQDNFHRASPTDFGERSWVKEIKVGKNNRPRGPKCWEFLLRLLRDNESNPSLVKWENPETGSFKLVEKDRISAIWGSRPSKKKNGKIIKYESFARILRYHYKKGSGKVLPVSEKHLVYKFASEVMAAYRAGKVL